MLFAVIVSFVVRVVASSWHCNGILMNLGIYWRFVLRLEGCGEYKGKRPQLASLVHPCKWSTLVLSMTIMKYRVTSKSFYSLFA
jgi:hypothetical protein